MNWRRARVAEWATLEMSYIRKGIRGSNPLASAEIPTLIFRLLALNLRKFNLTIF